MVKSRYRGQSTSSRRPGKSQSNSSSDDDHDAISDRGYDDDDDDTRDRNSPNERQTISRCSSVYQENIFFPGDEDDITTIGQRRVPDEVDVSFPSLKRICELKKDQKLDRELLSEREVTRDTYGLGRRVSSIGIVGKLIRLPSKLTPLTISPIQTSELSSPVFSTSTTCLSLNSSPKSPLMNTWQINGGFDSSLTCAMATTIESVYGSAPPTSSGITSFRLKRKYSEDRMDSNTIQRVDESLSLADIPSVPVTDPTVEDLVRDTPPTVFPHRLPPPSDTFSRPTSCYPSQRTPSCLGRSKQASPEFISTSLLNRSPISSRTISLQNGLFSRLSLG
jgi:hypothetical protein